MGNDIKLCIHSGYRIFVSGECLPLGRLYVKERDPFGTEYWAKSNDMIEHIGILESIIRRIQKEHGLPNDWE